MCPNFRHRSLMRWGWEKCKEILHFPACFSATSLNGICSHVMRCCHGCCATLSPLPVNGELCLFVLRQYFYVLSAAERIRNPIFQQEKKIKKERKEKLRYLPLLSAQSFKTNIRNRGIYDSIFRIGNDEKNPSSSDRPRTVGFTQV